MNGGDAEREAVGSILTRSTPSFPATSYDAIPAEPRFKPRMGHLNQNFLLPAFRCNRLLFCSQVSPPPLTLALRTRPQELVNGLFLCGSFPAALLWLSRAGGSELAREAEQARKMLSKPAARPGFGKQRS